MDVIIFSGQSNMQGETEARPTEGPVENAFEYLYKNDCLEPLAHPVGETLGYDPTHCSGVLLDGSEKKRGSLLPAFCREYVRTAKGVVAIHTALGTTTVSQWQPGTERYRMMVTKAKKGIEKVKEDFGEMGHLYFVWLQGESDAIEGTDKCRYLALLKALKDALKQDLGIEAFGIIKVGYFASEAGWLNDRPEAERQAADEAIMAAQEEAVTQDGDFVMLSRLTTTLSRQKDEYINPQCDGHYNNRAMTLIGTEAGRTLAQYAGTR